MNREHIRSVSPSTGHSDSRIGDRTVGQANDAHRITEMADFALAGALRRSSSIWLLAALLALTLSARPALAGETKTVEQQICNATADFFLGLEDYHQTIRLHRQILDHEPNNALAHYHLGFAYGMVGDRTAEKGEYLRAIGLGLSQWDLLLNLGLAYLEDGEHEEALRALRGAATAAPDRPEAHFNLALAYESLGMRVAALQEISTSLRLDPNQPDARNTLGVIYAELGDYRRAEKEWTDLVRTAPNYTPAQANLAALHRATRSRPGATGGGFASLSEVGVPRIPWTSRNK